MFNFLEAPKSKAELLIVNVDNSSVVTVYLCIG